MSGLLDRNHGNQSLKQKQPDIETESVTISHEHHILLSWLALDFSCHDQQAQHKLHTHNADSKHALLAWSLEGTNSDLVQSDPSLDSHSLKKGKYTHKHKHTHTQSHSTKNCA